MLKFLVKIACFSLVFERVKYMGIFPPPYRGGKIPYIYPPKYSFIFGCLKIFLELIKICVYLC